MSAARDYPSISKSLRLKRSRKTLRTYPSVNSKKISKISNIKNKVHHYLQFLLLINRFSTTFTFCLVTLTLGVYGWTVQMPTLWSQEFRKLTRLQQEERYLIGTNEVLKHQLVQQAQKPEVGLTQLHSKDLIFLPDIKVVPLSVNNTRVANLGNLWITEAPIAY